MVGSNGAYSSTAHLITSFLQDQTNYRGIYLDYDSAGQIGLISPTSNGAASQLSFWNYSGTNWFEAMPLTANGNVGIGTASPAVKLDVQGGNLNVYNQGSATVINIDSGVTGKTLLSLSTSADAGGYGAIQSVSASNSAWGNTIINQNGGNVGIGTTQPDQKLTVNGTIHSTEVKVTAAVPAPDYVFEPTYKLPQLSELKTYLDANHHLPEMPSAADIEKEGLNLGEMNLKLLKKVEELTLYMVKKDKEVVSLQRQINNLAKKMNKRH